VPVEAVAPDRRTRPDPVPSSSPEQAWRLAAAVAGRARVRISRAGGRSCPAGCERALTGELPDRPAAVLLFDDAASARCSGRGFRRPPRRPGGGRRAARRGCCKQHRVAGTITGMASNLQRRPRNSKASELPIMAGRVRPEIHEKARRIAEARGLTLALYLQQLVEQDEEPGIEKPQDEQEELPLTRAS
jgi:hypothetical protein